MKKTLIAMLIAVVSTSLFAADYYAYDYKASIKRLDLVVTYKKKTAIMQKYKVANDTIKGVVLIPICANCLAQGGAAESIDSEANNGFSAFGGKEKDGAPIPSLGWFIRVGDKLSEKYGIPYVAFDSDVFVATAKFGAYTLGKEVVPQDRKNNRQAWMKLGYALKDNGGVLDVSAIEKRFSDEDVDYRFLGVSNSDVGYVVNTGFGTVKPTSETIEHFNPCDGASNPDVYSCDMVISITGTLCGGPQYDAMMDDDPTDPYYNGLCNTTPMWDLCMEDLDHYAVICGTWTLKYNAKLTEAFFNNGEIAVLAHLGKAIDALDVYEAR